MTAPAGLLLAAGAGRRMGRPKALVELDGVPLVGRALDVLRAGGCGPLLVVLGAAADEVASVLPADVLAVTAADWAEGMGASLRAGLDALAALSSRRAQDSDPKCATHPHKVRNTPTRSAQHAGVEAALVHLVDLPGVGAAAIARLCAAATGPRTLGRACYRGVPGHPVLLGRAHWTGVRAAATGDSGGRGYLAGHPELRLVECGDVADPGDVDTPEALRAFRART